MSVIDKFRNLALAIRQNGGLWRSVQTLYRIDDVKDGNFVGEDRNGNKYYENPRYFVGRSRWVVYHEKYGMDYDGTHIDPEWHGWIHYTRDEPPTQLPPITYKWVDAVPEPNKTGTKDMYVPYTTTKPKVEAWIPKAQRKE